jgi:hypothetical protein
MSFCQGSSAYTAGPEEQLIEAVKVALGKNFNTDWSGLDALPGIKWAPLPPRSLQNCLPEGGYFSAARRGQVRMKTPALFKSIDSINQYGNLVPMPFSNALW